MAATQCNYCHSGYFCFSLHFKRFLKANKGHYSTKHKGELVSEHSEVKHSNRMSFLLPKLSSKLEVDKVIKETEDLVLVLRFGRENDTACLQLDNIVSSVVS